MAELGHRRVHVYWDLTPTLHSAVHNHIVVHPPDLRYDVPDLKVQVPGWFFLDSHSSPLGSAKSAGQGVDFTGMGVVEPLDVYSLILRTHFG